MKVCLDPGHGGSDPGAVGGVVEKNITLPTTLELGKYFSFLGISVTYTRTTDTDVTLDNRAAIANNAGCDYFISVHSNAGGGTGIETYAYAAGGKGEQLAQKVQSQLIAYTGMRDRGVKFANFAVLRETVMPAILIENGFVDTADADIIKTEAHKQKFCAAVARAFCQQVGITWKDMYAQPAPVPVDLPALQKQIADLQAQLAAVNKEKGILTGKMQALEQQVNEFKQWTDLTKKLLGL